MAMGEVAELVRRERYERTHDNGVLAEQILTGRTATMGAWIPLARRSVIYPL